MTHCSPDNNNVRPHNLLRQPQADDEEGWAARKELRWHYLPSRTFENNKLGDDKSRHACFASKAWLKQVRFRNPRPPQIFGRHKDVHFFLGKCGPLGEAQRNWRIIAVSLCWKQSGMRKTDMRYTGMEWSTCFTKIPLPAKFKNSHFQPWSLDWTQLKREL